MTRRKSFTLDADQTSILFDLIANPRLATGLGQIAQDQLIIKGAMATLFQVGSPDAIQVFEALVVGPVPESVSQLAFQFLVILAAQGSLPAWDSLCLLAVDADHPQAREIAVNQKYLPIDRANQAAFLLLTDQIPAYAELDPAQKLLTDRYRSSLPEVRKRIRLAASRAGLEEWVHVVQAAVDSKGESLFALTDMLPKISTDSLRALGLDLISDLVDSGDADARKTLLNLYLYQNYAPARERITQKAILPQDPVRRALWFFLTEQWEKYASLDFNQSLLASAYEGAPQDLRRRIVATVRRSGRIDWMQKVYHGRQIRWLADMTDLDWQAVTQLLERDQKWPEYWQLAQSAPPIWSARMLLRLRESGWSPPDEDNRNALERLAYLAEECSRMPILLHSPVSLRGPAVEINCLAANPSGNMVAAGNSQSSIYLWRLPEKQVARIIQTSPGQVWTLAFSPDGQHLLSGHADHMVRIWRLEDQRLVKTLEGHQGTVRGLAVSSDNRSAISVGFDGQLKIWRIPFGPEIKSIAAHKGEIFAISLDPNGELAASGGADRSIRIWSLPSGTLVRTLEGHADTVTSLAVSPDEQYLVSGSRDRSVKIWSFPDGFALKSLNAHENLVTALAFHPHGRFFASGGFDGKVNLWSSPEGNYLQSLEGFTGPVTGLCFAANGDSLLTSGKDGSLKLWDLRPFLSLSLPIEHVHMSDIRDTQQAAEDPGLSEAERKWFRFARELIQWRRRFDISLSERPERPHVQIGEYDIEL
ncbi:MAG TPA: WD40 repeat domain-containing protein [Anaerolineaceae bacterium]|nr:WD40 repeat domain-containing protein [Anaerolineaceae bacterium]